jgi:hypothetical protein
MREPNEMVLADMIAARAERTPDLDVLTFEQSSFGAACNEATASP